MTNLRYQYLPNRAPDDADVIVLPVPYEQTVSYKLGTRGAPEAILAATEQLEYYEEDLGWSPFKHMGVCVAPAVDKRLYEREEDFLQRLERETAAFPQRALLLALGGEHSITPALVRARMKEPGTLVLLDAHADLREEFEGSRNSHACPMHHVREAGHEIVMIGIRSLFEAEAQRISKDSGIHCYMDRALREDAVWKELLGRLRGLKGPVWLSVDMDALDPALVKGVGTPQPGGLDWYRALAVIESCVLNAQVDLRGCDIVEMIPEPSCVSDMTAAKLSQKIVSCWGKRNGFDARPETGSQTEVSYQ
ncbi:MAG: agmatinase [Ectothiorhodospiraceae bacterium]|jgi:agmatinase